MKILKRAEQRNFIIDKSFFTFDEIFNLVSKYNLFGFDENSKIYTSINMFDTDVKVFDLELRISVEKCKEVKVVYSKVYEQYISVVVTNDNMIIPIEL